MLNEWANKTKNNGQRQADKFSFRIFFNRFSNKESERTQMKHTYNTRAHTVRRLAANFIRNIHDVYDIRDDD